MPGIFGFFDYTKEGKGVYPDEPPKAPVVAFFSILGRKFWKIIQINLMYLIFSLPAIIVSVLLATFAINWLFPGLTVEALARLIEATGVVLGEGATFETYAASQMLIIYIMIGLLLSGLSLVVVGPVHAGFTYVLRNYSREEHAFIWMDFKEHLAKNLKQSVLSALISIAVTVVILFNLSFYLNTDMNLGIFRPLLTTLLIIFLAFWCILQMYLYPMMVTFQLTLRQLYKNCLLFTFLRLPVNALILLISLILLFGIPFTLFLVGSGVSFMLVVLYYLFLAFGVNLLMTNFFIYRGLDKYMIQKLKNADELNEEAIEESPADQLAGHSEPTEKEELAPQQG